MHAIAYWPTLMTRPVLARRAVRASRRGSHRRAIRSILGVALCCRASDRMATASVSGLPWARSRTAANRRLNRRPPNTSPTVNAARQNTNTTPIAQPIAIAVSRSNGRFISLSPPPAASRREGRGKLGRSRRAIDTPVLISRAAAVTFPLPFSSKGRGQRQGGKRHDRLSSQTISSRARSRP